MEEQHPLISCICVTKNRPALLVRAIECFINQSYSNKELVILLENNDHATIAVCPAYQTNKHVRFITVEHRNDAKLGQLRNEAVAAASGKYICQWDDDDWYHKDRLLCQFHSLNETGFAACLLSRWLIFDETTSTAVTSHSRFWEGSILCTVTISFFPNKKQTS